MLENSLKALRQETDNYFITYLRRKPEVLLFISLNLGCNKDLGTCKRVPCEIKI